MIDLTGAQPPWPASALALWTSCVARAAAVPVLWAEPEPRGDRLLREGIGGQFGLDPDELTVTAGLRASALTYARRCTRVRVERPTFAGAVAVLAGAGARVEHAPWDRLCAESDATVWVTSPARNPDGASLGDSERSRLERHVAGGGHVVVNATYWWFAPDARMPRGADVIGSFSKVGGMGARLGWVHGRSYLDRAVPELLGTSPSRVWQRAWGLFLADGGLAELRTVSVERPAAAARAFRAVLAEEYDVPLPGAEGPNLLLELAHGVAGEDVACERIAAAGCLVLAGRHFSAVRPAVRVNFAGVDPDRAAVAAHRIAGTRQLAPGSAVSPRRSPQPGAGR